MYESYNIHMNTVCICIEHVCTTSYMDSSTVHTPVLPSL